MLPTGWFQVGWSSTVPPEGVVPLRYFGSDLVAWRDKGGTVHALDAYCQHLGANLAHGGVVNDDGIQCPFHGWTWNGDGHNVSIPYQHRPNKARRIRRWPVVECNEVLYLWHDTQDREPFFEVPDFTSGVFAHIEGLRFQPALPDCTSHFAGLNVHPQYVIENAVDPQHFRFVHGTPTSPKVLREDVTETTWHTVAGCGGSPAAARPDQDRVAPGHRDLEQPEIPRSAGPGQLRDARLQQDAPMDQEVLSRTLLDLIR